MFASAVPASPTVSTNTTTPPIPQSSPSRPSRLRGLSYLRNYTQHHLSSHLQQSSTTAPQRNGFIRTTSSPGPQTTSNEDQTPSAISPTLPASDWRQSSSAQAESSSSSTQHRTESTEQADRDVTASSALGGISKIMARHRAGNNPQSVRRGGQAIPPELGGPVVRAQPRERRRSPSKAEAPTSNTSTVPVEPSGLTGLPLDQMPTIKFIPHQDPRAAKPSLQFTATSRTLPHEDCVIRVGRYSERDGNINPPPNVPSSAPVGFKSKVVSRRHCEFWCSQGQWYIKDVKSSSGTFLNHIRLSQPSVESRPFPLNDGDVVQLGIDFRGGEEQIFRCVKIRIECNRSWQKGLNNFNMTTHKQLRALGKSDVKKEADESSVGSSECSICLMLIAPCQSLFVAPCSHVWHYKCIRPILSNQKTYPQFLCPNCRAVADLEADIDDQYNVDWNEEEDGGSSPDEAGGANEDNNPETGTKEEGTDQDADRLAIEHALLDENPRLGVTEGPASGENVEMADYGFPNVADHSMHGENVTVTPRVSIALGGLSSNPSEILTGNEGPLTPRNDIGPFVFDGSAGRDS
ncbi:MAG: hypothetical protein MMC33_009697 [Icmadophila ericetorum]|nr:hypothetical protein [Icmadophila ericetorum]